MSGISAKLPLRMSEEDGAYLLNKTLGETVKQNFKMLLLTIPGERMMDIEFGIGLQTFLFNMNNSETYSAISAKIHEQVARYMPFISVNDEYFGPTDDEIYSSPNSVAIRISYSILSTGEEDSLLLTLPQKNIEF